MNKYSLKKTIWKGIKGVLQFLLPVILVYLQSTGIAEKTITDIIVKFAPWFGALTVGGCIVALNNYLKNH